MSVVIHGTVADLAGRPGAGQRVAVLAWAPGASISVMLVQGFADTEGRFRLEYAEPVDDAYVTACALGADGRVLGWTENLAGAPAGALVRIALGATNPIPISAGRPEDTVLDLPSSGSLAPPPAPDGEEYAVSGRISWPDGSPAIGVVVRVVDKDLRGEQQMGPYAPSFEEESRTDGAGRYRIPYLSKQFSRHEIASADLVVRVLARDARIAAASPVLFNAPRDATVDLVLPARVPKLPAEFERVVAALDRLLGHPEDSHRSERDAEETAGAIGAADVPFLTGETGIPADRFQAVLAAIALVAEPSGTPSDSAGAESDQWVPAASNVSVLPGAQRSTTAATVPIEVFYGLIRVGVPAHWLGLAQFSADRLATAANRAVDEGIISDRLRAAAQRHAHAIASAAAEALGRWRQQGAQLADAALRYARTGTVANPVLDARLDRALRDAVLEAVGSDSAALGVAIAPALAELSWRAVRPQAAVATSAVSVLNAAARLDPAVGAAAQAAIARLDQQPVTTVAEVLSLDVPLRDNPWLAEDLAAATVTALGKTAGFDDAALGSVTAAAAGLVAEPELTLAGLVSEAALTADQAAAVRVLLELGNLTDGNLPLIKALSAQGAASPAALAGWSTEQWRRLLRPDGGGSAALPLPPGLSVEQYADLMVANLEFAYPAQALAARLSAERGPVAGFFADNPNVDLRAVDLARGEVGALNWQSVPDEQRSQVEAELRSYQRLLALADTTADRVALSRNGFDSAFAIVELPEAEFTARSGLDVAVARLTYARAQDLAASAAHAYGAAQDAVQPPWPTMPVATTYPDFVDDLRRIRGLTELLGPERSCECGDCDSVLGPVAYFVDLMHFAERQRHLKDRRPDLWSLPLTCDNANAQVPAIQIVNEVLEARLTGLLGGDPYQALADPDNTTTCAVPVDLPYAELGIYLAHFGLTPADVYRMLQLPDATIERALTGLSADEAAIVTTADETGIVQRLGVADAADLASLAVQQYLRRMGLTQDDLSTLLSARSHPDLAGITVSEDRLQGLTAARADAAFRFIRLARALPWTPGELDMVLTTAQRAGLIGEGIDAAAVRSVGRLIRVQRQLDLTVQRLCTLISGDAASTIDPRIAALLPGIDITKADLPQIEQLIAAAAWVAESRFTLDQLQLILTGTATSSTPYANTRETVSALVQALQAAGSAPSALTTLKTELAAVFDVSSERLAAMLAWTGRDLADGMPDDSADLADPADSRALLDLVQRLERVALLFAQLKFDDDTVGFLTASYAKLGIADRAALTFADIQALTAYAGYCARATPAGTATTTRALLDAYAAADSFSPDQHASLALLTGAERSLVDSVLAAFALPAVPLAALNRADEIIACCKRLGVDAYALLKLGKDGSYAELAAAAQVARAAVGAQCADETARVNALKRDALCGHLIDGCPELRLGSRKDLHDYFLIDVDAAAGARTTRVAAAISSVQLYIQRCLLGLEQADPAQLPRDQWAWRRSFRVWQADREVFLHPESSLAPDLRDDKTATFAGLEIALAQRSADDAYAGYLAEVDQLADLDIIEACYDAASDTHTILGRTRQDPPTLYCRTWDGTTWQPWTPVAEPAALNGSPEPVIEVDGRQFLVQGNRSPLRLGGRPARRLEAAAERQSSSATHVIGGQPGPDDAPQASSTAPEASAEPGSLAASSTPILFTALASAERSTLIHLTGALGTYRRERFLHVPWLIADRLRAAGRHEEALRWFRHLFDPTAAESPADAAPADRVWRHADFRGLNASSLARSATDPAALAAYRDDPFNPFAVARLRPAAFQKAIVAQFVGNLMDWADELIAQNTAESIGEAALLCALASDLLGPRPAKPAGRESELTYEAVGPALATAPDSLVALENWVYQTRWSALGYAAAAPEQPAPPALCLLPFDTVSALVNARAQLPAVWTTRPIRPAYPPHLVIQAARAFRVPPSAALLACWAGVEERLAKIRNR